MRNMGGRSRSMYLKSLILDLKIISPSVPKPPPISRTFRGTKWGATFLSSLTLEDSLAKTC